MSETPHNESAPYRKVVMGIALLLLVATALFAANHFTTFFHHSEEADYTVRYEPLSPQTQEEAIHEQEHEQEEPVFTLVEKMPELKGGIASIANTITYPEVAKKAGIEGRVFVEFVVGKDGTVTNAKVVRGIGGGCDEEAVRAVSQATFTPGEQRGIHVPVKMTIPVTFKLST